MGQACSSKPGKAKSLEPQDSKSIQNDIKIFAQCKAGMGNKKAVCQDSFCFMERFPDKDHYFFAVYDGFGKEGKLISTLYNDAIQTYIENNVKKYTDLTTEKKVKSFFSDAIKEAEKNIKNQESEKSEKSGCTFCGVYINKNTYYGISVGNCKGALGSKKIGKDDEAECKVFSDAHSLFLPQEKERVIKAGATVKKADISTPEEHPDRLYIDPDGPGCTTTRALGAHKYKKVLINECEVHSGLLGDGDFFIVLGTDGLWSVFNPSGACDFVLNQRENIELSATNLVMEARKRWELMDEKNFIGIEDEDEVKKGCDDITAIIAVFDKREDSNQAEARQRVFQSRVHQGRGSISVSEGKLGQAIKTEYLKAQKNGLKSPRNQSSGSLSPTPKQNSSGVMKPSWFSDRA